MVHIKGASDGEIPIFRTDLGFDSGFGTRVYHRLFW